MIKIFKRLFGISETALCADPQAWSVTRDRVRVDLARMPELRSAGGAVRLEGNGLKRRLLVFHGDDGRYHAVENHCTHMGRRIDPIVGGNRIECCSVSRSTYGYDGQPLGGAAKKPLRALPVRLDGATLTIGVTD